MLPGTRRKRKFDEAVHGQSMNGDGAEELLADSPSGVAIGKGNENGGIIECLGSALEIITIPVFQEENTQTSRRKATTCDFKGSIRTKHEPTFKVADSSPSLAHEIRF